MSKNFIQVTLCHLFVFIIVNQEKYPYDDDDTFNISRLIDREYNKDYYYVHMSSFGLYQLLKHNFQTLFP